MFFKHPSWRISGLRTVRRSGWSLAAHGKLLLLVKEFLNRLPSKVMQQRIAQQETSFDLQDPLSKLINHFMLIIDLYDKLSKYYI
ncbi:hypothetical protein O3P69_003697 [Scylla paramamosain]|uniref:Uncharacterized protein n=1 Tax=Scylla paramamosain TaxID=85552 RepID=A0AAW0UG96_SCYPA